MIGPSTAGLNQQAPPPPAAPVAPQPPAGAAATVVTPSHNPVAAAPPPQPAVPPPAAAPPPPRAAGANEGATEYVDVRSLTPTRVVGVFVAVEGDLEGQVYPIGDGENKLGRAPTCEIEMPSKKISREHAKVVHQDGVFAIMPLSDQNPTILNDEATEGSELNDGDFVRLGRTTLRFRSVI